MSNIGKQPITIPEGVKVSRKETSIIVKGKLGELSQEFNSDIQIEINDKEVIVTRKTDEKIQRELHGLTRVLIANMVKGISEGFQKELNLVGVGYSADASKGNFLVLNVGYSHHIYFEKQDYLYYIIFYTLAACRMDLLAYRYQLLLYFQPILLIVLRPYFVMI